MRVAYADPPYLGQRTRYGYPEWDTLPRHVDLIQQLVTEFPDGWALSASSPSLRLLLPACPDDIRIGAWVKPFCAFKRGVRPCYAWEPVIYRGGRNKHHPPPVKGGKQTTPKGLPCGVDHVAAWADWCQAGFLLSVGAGSVECPARRRGVRSVPGHRRHGT